MRELFVLSSSGVPIIPVWHSGGYPPRNVPDLGSLAPAVLPSSQGGLSACQWAARAAQSLAPLLYAAGAGSSRAAGPAAQGAPAAVVDHDGLDQRLQQSAGRPEDLARRPCGAADVSAPPQLVAVSTLPAAEAARGLRQVPPPPPPDAAEDEVGHWTRFPIEERGVRLAWLGELVENLTVAGAVFEGRPDFTTTELVEKFIKPATEKSALLGGTSDVRLVGNDPFPAFAAMSESRIPHRPCCSDAGCHSCRRPLWRRLQVPLRGFASQQRFGEACRLHLARLEAAVQRACLQREPTFPSGGERLGEDAQDSAEHLWCMIG